MWRAINRNNCHIWQWPYGVYQISYIIYHRARTAIIPKNYFQSNIGQPDQCSRWYTSRRGLQRGHHTMRKYFIDLVNDFYGYITSQHVSSYDTPMPMKWDNFNSMISNCWWVFFVYGFIYFDHFYSGSILIHKIFNKNKCTKGEHNPQNPQYNSKIQGGNSSNEI